jgi:ubiquinone/menaquinone biosynthesis C-methylase UbiE
MHWTDTYFGDLYLDSVADLLTPELSEIEAAVIARLLQLSAGHRVLDLACGHGRHAIPLAARVRMLAGVDRSGAYLRRAAEGAAGFRPPPRLVRADLRRLPFPAEAFDGIYSWYASLFMFGEAGNAAALAELGRVLRRGGRALVHHANPVRLAADPIASARRILADGTTVEEEAHFDAASGVERAHRRLVRPDGTTLAGTAVLRYYRPEEWASLAGRAGLRVLSVTSTTGAGAGPGPSELGPDAPDLIAVLEKR